MTALATKPFAARRPISVAVRRITARVVPQRKRAIDRLKDYRARFLPRFGGQILDSIIHEFEDEGLVDEVIAAIPTLSDAQIERLALRAQVAIDDREADNLDQMQCWVDANGPDSAYEVA